MKQLGIFLLLAMIQLATAEEKSLTGTVTYVAVGTVYTSLGRESGVKDSSLVYVKSGPDTVAILKVIAVSSKSSACRIVKSKGTVTAGVTVSAIVTIDAPPADTTGITPQIGPSRGSLLPPKVAAIPDAIELRGRVSAQYYTNRYDNASYNTTQPGVVINLRARSTDIPLRFELYSNLRTLAYGNASPFSRSAVNQSRVYHLSLQYDDGLNDISVGRIIPMFAPALGYIDGAMYSRKLGMVTLGTALGFQPGYTLQGVSTDYKKAALIASIQPDDSLNLIISSSYARTYYRTLLDREVVSGAVSLYTFEGFQVYAYAEGDLRAPVNGTLALSPHLTSMFANVSYRVTRMLSLGVGADASRPLYTFSIARAIPDSLRETRLRSGINTTISLSLPAGISLSNTYAPRMSEARFARVYTNYTTVGIADVFSSGIFFRSTFNLNANEYSSSNAYGASLQRNILDVADVNVRYQQNTYTVKNYGDRHISHTIGTDLILNLTRMCSVMMSYDRLDGYGIRSDTVFGELSVRF